jgi:hypothetical protein
MDDQLEPDVVKVGNCCPDEDEPKENPYLLPEDREQLERGLRKMEQERLERDAQKALESARIVDPHLPERDEAVKIARNAYPHLGGNQEAYDPGPPPDDEETPDHVAIQWVGRMRVEKYREGDATPYEVIESEPNLLVNAGIDFILNRIVGTTGTSFNSTNAYIGVGTGTTAPAAGQTDLQGGTKTRELVDGAPTVSSQVLTFVATFETTDANHAWSEWGLFNASTAGTMLNRSVTAFGTKTSAESWVATVTVTLVGT